jgi:hypothetical protein
MRNFAGRFSASQVRLVVFYSMVMAGSVSTSALAENPGCTATGTGEPCVVGAGTQNSLDFVSPPDGFAVFATGTGPAAHGFLAFTSPFGSGGPNFVAQVTCLMVLGNNAIATGIFTQPESAKGQRVVMQAVDNGGAPKDLLRFSFAGAIVAAPGDSTGKCWLPVLPPVPIRDGHIAVGKFAAESGD